MAEQGPEARRSSLSDVLADFGELPDLGSITVDHPQDVGPGREVVDLPEHLALLPEGSVRPGALVPRPRGLSVTRTLDTVAGFAAQARTSLASDYVRCTWLADELRGAGLHVVEHPGWKRRGRPREVGPFVSHGLLWHHDASARGPSPELAQFIAVVGRPAEGIPAPLAQLWVCMGCKGKHPVGTWHVLAAGRANHGGEGDGWGRIGRDLANSTTLGVETDNTTGEATPPQMFASLVVGSAAILRRLRSDPRQWLCAHREYAPGRKFDPEAGDIDMNRGRRLVVRLMHGRGHWKPEPFPGAEHFQLGRACSHGYVTQLGRWLVAAGFDRHGDQDGYQPGPVFTDYDRANLAAFQRQAAHVPVTLRTDGRPDAETWLWLQRAARHGRSP